MFNVIAGALLCCSQFSAAINWNKLSVVQFDVDANYTYSTSINVGTPPQPITVDLDFGSADLSMAGEPVKSDCPGGSCLTFFNISASQSFHYSKRYVDSVVYSDGTPLTGFFINDVVSLQGATIDSATMLIRNSTSISQQDVSTTYSSFGDNAYYNALGLGPRGMQSGTVWLDENGIPGPLYPSFLEGVSKSQSYSVWVDPVTNSTGFVNFGGLDESSYDPSTFVSVPIVNFVNTPSTEAYNITALREPIYLGIAYNNITVKFKGAGAPYVSSVGSAAQSIAILNSRVEFSVPLTVMRSIATILGAQWSSVFGAYLMRCSLQPQIVSNMDNFSFEVYAEDILDTTDLVDAQGEPVCALNIGRSDQVYLSNRVLRHYYLVVNYLTNSLAFARPLPNEPGVQQIFNHINSSYPEAMATMAPASVRFEDPATMTRTVTNWGLDATPISFAPSQSATLGLETTIKPRRTYVELM